MVRRISMTAGGGSSEEPTSTTRRSGWLSSMTAATTASGLSRTTAARTCLSTLDSGCCASRRRTSTAGRWLYLHRCEQPCGTLGNGQRSFHARGLMALLGAKVRVGPGHVLDPPEAEVYSPDPHTPPLK